MTLEQIKHLVDDYRRLKKQNKKFRTALKKIRDADYSYERGICSDLHDVAKEALDR